MNNRIPNLFIVGAQKCGTTAVAEYMRSHPEIFVPLQKEPWFWGADLDRNFKKIDRTYYESMYEGAGAAKYLLDASPLYIKSASFIHEIQAEVDNPKIIVMLRNPIELVYSLFFQLKYNREENAKDFSIALSLQENRKNNPALTREFLFPINAQYIEIGKNCQQVIALIEVFGRKNVHIVLFDDFKEDSSREYKKILKFLELPELEPESYKIVNPHKVSRTKSLNKLATSPPKWMGSLSSIFFSKETRWKIRQYIKNKNTIYTTREKMAVETKNYLAQAFREETESLSTLLDRDLSHWVDGK
jgi:hypothetical protein